MRNFASLVLWTGCIFGASLACAATPAALPMLDKTPVQILPEKSAEQVYGISEETPNQRRKRLGQPIVESFPPLNYGEAIETPNHRRKRLGLPQPGQQGFQSTESEQNRQQRLKDAYRIEQEINFQQ